MAELLLAGVTHYPPLAGIDDEMAGIHRRMLADPDVPEHEKNPANWPAAQRAEWGDDEARSAAADHRRLLRAGFATVRAEIERFDPDAILIWGDDQYENFTEDLIPPYALLAYDDLVARPWIKRLAPNAWGEPADAEFEVRGHPELARWLAGNLLDNGIDVSYAYRPRNHPDLAHAFLNAILFLDYDREGFPWPVVAMPVNCYGRRVISARGTWKPLGEELVLDPPSPSPSRLMDVGGAVARALQASPWRVVLLASSSWSHAFLVDHNYRLRPDIPADRRLYDALVAGEFGTWAETPLSSVEHAGQQEVLNWWCLAGAARQLDLGGPAWSTFIETQCFNSNKVFATWEPVG
ncbi:MAG: extradiol ring-cleavage dioxygenase [Acidimicrobiales bacterium]